MKFIPVCTLVITLFSAQILTATSSFATVCDPITKVCWGGHKG